ncbi:hypothetical protein ACQR1I_35505 [Bradyrhizobium sp. HKCCYLS2038]|uniref:hypothetical protein n=1 Tax=unclassified Bradyrhizobium TaxID=2631580 RepID=UPI003EB845DA
MKPLPQGPALLSHVGRSLYGDVGWRQRLAAGLGVSRNTLYNYLSGRWAFEHIVPDIVDLIDRERGVLISNGAKLRRLGRMLQVKVKR